MAFDHTIFRCLHRFAGSPRHLGVTPRVLPSLAVLVQWRRPRESPVPQRIALDWIFFLPTRRPKDNLFEGLCQDLDLWRMRTMSNKGLGHQVRLADFLGFVCEVEHEFLGTDVKLSAVLTCADIIKIPNRALCSQVGVSPGQTVCTVEGRRLVWI